MLKLKNIVKKYTTGDTTISALKGIDLEFRQNEFVSVLGQSGCGKTTLLNIIGGLDRYTSGDLFINGRSTKDFSDNDWDIYRNNSIGFVFQSYNLIPHQTVLSNVELALTLSGVSKSERRERALAVLEKVGLTDQIHKKPNQMSGGQMQRVAIARALVNNPEILLADEPTGALDSETSFQIMALLKEIAEDRLIIMVTHNPDLAEEYSTRTINLLDGEVIQDSDPYTAEEEIETDSSKKKKKKKRKISMSFFTALSLSLNNLMTKKGRTFMTAFAGSIGIIGIALILSLSNGIQSYIDRVQEDTLSTYPLTIQQQSIDISAMTEAMMGVSDRDASSHDMDKIYSYEIMSNMMNSMIAQIDTNDLQAFKKFIESEESGISPHANALQYSYALDLQLYNPDTSNGIVQVNPNKLMEELFMGGASASSANPMAASMTNMNVWTEMISNQTLLNSQYDILAGEWPTAFNEVVIIVDEFNEISDYTLYSLGIRDQSDIRKMIENSMLGKATETQSSSYTYDELLNLKFKLVLNSDYYEKFGDSWVDKSNDEEYLKNLINNGVDIKIVGIIRPNEEAVALSISSAIGYTSDLTEYLINEVNNTEVVKQQLASPEINVFTGFPFATNGSSAPAFDFSMLTEEQLAYIAGLSDEEKAEIYASYAEEKNASYEQNLATLGVVNLDNPSAINIFPKDFDAKEAITDIIADYNAEKTAAGQEELVINYTDMVGLLMSSVTSIVNTVSYVLIAFVAISLVVSSIMIGIITYISVLERTKEIGILRSIGASKRDISRVFNAETLIVGLVSGLIGIGTTLLLCIPANIIIKSLTDISGIASLPPVGGVVLIIISMMLTVIAGLIPSRVAAKKDPVVALRTE